VVVKVGWQSREGLPASPAPFELGANRLEVHEPRFEQRVRDCLQRLAHASVQFDFVVQRAENVGNRALLGEGGDLNLDTL
jgi:hypothetical protein